MSFIGQSAIEYLMTYGWMLLVVAIVGGAIFSVVGEQSIESVSGFTGGDIDVENFGFSQVGSLDAVLRNTAPDSVVVSEVILNQSGEEFRKDIDEEVGVGESFKISDLGAFESSEADSVDVEIRHSVGELSNLTVSGTISGSLTVVGNRLGGGKVSHVDSEGEIYRVHKFGDVGAENLTVYEETEVDVLLVGGGGGGAGQAGRGGGSPGGAGGLIYEEGFEVSAGDKISLVVGAGGLGGEGGEDEYGESGEATSFGELEAIGGGGGVPGSDESGVDGGSGSGGQGDDGDRDGEEGTGEPGGSGIEGQGHEGGAGSYNNENTRYRVTGGGGGAGEPGEDGHGDEERSGSGGDGLYFGDVFEDDYGEDGWFAGGGGGGTRRSGGIQGEGGLGGGTGGTAGGNDAEDAMSNTGGGGGGGGSSDNEADGGDGGSGIVLIRYPLTGLD